MKTLTPEWTFLFLWFLAGIGATGAFWYFLSKDDRYTALWIALATGVIVLLTITLHIRNDLVRKEHVESHNRPNVFFKSTQFIENAGAGGKFGINLEIKNAGTTEALIEFSPVGFRFEPTPFSTELAYPAGSNPPTFTLSPSQETNIRFEFPLPNYDVSIAALKSDPPRARLYIYAKGWYGTTSGSKTYDLSFCRMFHASTPGNLIHCPDEVRISDPVKNAQSNN